MQLKIKFNKRGLGATQIFGWAALFALMATPALAQVRELEPAAKMLGYRNGASWITVERAAKGVDRVQPMLFRAGDRTFHAEVGPHAIVQLDARTPDNVWQREHLQVIEALSPALRMYLVRGRGNEDGVDVAQRLAAAPGIAAAIPDLYLQLRSHSIAIPPNDAMYGGQWYLKKIMIERAWRHSTGDRETTVAVIDDGCDLRHPDLQANMLEGRDAINDTNDASYVPRINGNSHGTACAGLIAAQADNQIGIAGVCPECTLRCVRLIRNDDKAVPVSATARAFNFVLEHDVSVVSNSWGYSESMPAPVMLRNLVETLFSEGRAGKGTLVVFAAGNENREIADDELAAIRGVLNIAASSNFDEATQFSNHGRSLDLTAPAGTVTTDISGSEGDEPGDYTQRFGGTSSACPVAAGAAALLMSAKPELTAEEVGRLLVETARPAPYATPDADGHDDVYGYGIVDPGAALRKALDITEPEPMDAGTTDSGTPDAGPAPEPKKDDSSSCSVMRVRGESGQVGVWLLALAAWLTVKRSRAWRVAAASTTLGNVPVARSRAHQRSAQRLQRWC